MLLFLFLSCLILISKWFQEEEHMDIRPKRRIWSGEDFDSDNDDDMASSKNSVLTAQTRLGLNIVLKQIVNKSIWFITFIIRG